MKKRKVLKYKNFNSILNFIRKFKLVDFNNSKKITQYMNFFELNYLLIKLREDKILNKNKKYLVQVKPIEKKPLPYELDDLCRLHWLVLSRKVFNTLEIGSGFSSVFIADAKFLLNYFFGKVENIRCEKQFHIYSLGEDKYFLKLTQKRIPQNLKKHVTLIHDGVDPIVYDGRYALRHKNLPNISPDLIYLDGPSLYATKKKIYGFSFNEICRVPMSADILFIEFFLEPGTFIVVDGRTANSEFLKKHFKRNWRHFHDIKGDCHYFELLEKPWGIWNKKKIEFCIDKKIKFF